MPSELKTECWCGVGVHVRLLVFSLKIMCNFQQGTKIAAWISIVFGVIMGLLSFPIGIIEGWFFVLDKCFWVIFGS
jgi:hypothetical protein